MRGLGAPSDYKTNLSSQLDWSTGTELDNMTLQQLNLFSLCCVGPYKIRIVYLKHCLGLHILFLFKSIHTCIRHYNLKGPILSPLFQLFFHCFDKFIAANKEVTIHFSYLGYSDYFLKDLDRLAEVQIF